MTYGPDDLPRVARALLARFGPARVYALVGQLGAGKTTLVAECCRQLGVSVPTSSPTFSLVNEYPTADGRTVYHLDCYRLNDLEEALSAGLEELFAEHEAATFFVEWPAVIEPLLPEDTVVVRLAHTPDGSARTLLTDPEISLT